MLHLVAPVTVTTMTISVQVTSHGSHGDATQPEAFKVKKVNKRHRDDGEEGDNHNHFGSAAMELANKSKNVRVWNDKRTGKPKTLHMTGIKSVMDLVCTAADVCALMDLRPLGVKVCMLNAMCSLGGTVPLSLVFEARGGFPDLEFHYSPEKHPALRVKAAGITLQLFSKPGTAGKAVMTVKQPRDLVRARDMLRRVVAGFVRPQEEGPVKTEHINQFGLVYGYACSEYHLCLSMSSSE